jgi:hypothetical protein
MLDLSLIGNGERQRHTINRQATIETLVSNLRAAEFALEESIRAEEERTCTREISSPHYSAAARSMRARADNIRATIAMLQADKVNFERSAMERRAIARTKVDAKAYILLAERSKPIRCTVVDLTGNGARIEIDQSTHDLEPTFEFSFDNFKTVRRARLVWTLDSSAGIEFSGP